MDLSDFDLIFKKLGGYVGTLFAAYFALVGSGTYMIWSLIRRDQMNAFTKNAIQPISEEYLVGLIAFIFFLSVLAFVALCGVVKKHPQLMNNK